MESDKRCERIRWRCRRGMLELDLALQRFVDLHLATLNDAGLDEFERLLALQDNELLDLVLKRCAPPPEVASVVRLLHESS